MPLHELNLSIDHAEMPREVRSFLAEADRRIERFQIESRVPGFVPCDFGRAYAVLRALAEADVAPGNLFCEWGSGFGVVACLAALVEFDACGIEIEAELVDAARQLADDFGLPVEFYHGSFIPAGSHDYLGGGDRFAWLTAEEAKSEEEFGLGPADFDVVFAYPWPDEEDLVADLFARHASAGAVLATYHGGDHFRLRKLKPGKRSRNRVKR